MLRILFGQPRRVDEGLYLQACLAIQDYMKTIDRGDPANLERRKRQNRLILWSRGFLDALNELEQSKYCCEQYAARVHKPLLEEMDQEELEEYRRFVYFYKNAFIRLFSILDKLGYFMNDLFELETEKVKSRFSYFTVQRRMHELKRHEQLEQQLFDLKNEYKVQVTRLRNQRNMEIHYINVEMLDDLEMKIPTFGEHIYVENIQANVADLDKGFEMVCRTMTTAFTYMAGLEIKE